MYAFCFGSLLLLLTSMLAGQTPAPPTPPTEADPTALAKETQNPVGDIVSVPFQFNFNSGGAYQDQTFFNLNFQPVIPIHLTPNWTLIARPIVPIDSIPAGNGVSYSGIGDIQFQTFFTPAHPGKIIWGIGPAFSFPTATAYPAKTGTWAAGPSIVILATPGPFVLGSLFVQLSPMTDATAPHGPTSSSGNTSLTTTSAKAGPSPPPPASPPTGTPNVANAGPFPSAEESAAHSSSTASP